ncbi:hypothetical protein SASPL_149558 [Salvia splendens]|uniref:Uncharacterized protein n=1 Tax=Salvia splendens TaxID=180675 RepID=A0A8X8Z566_SALSN|nr:uncharacterized protein LOC121778528 isoform X2 [Salvia splendens]KAG6391798.1 hypothetical protein SASPL_149558 [Salvia splendens]
MDVWVVAAAAGAGYVVQHLKNLGRGKNKWVDSSSESRNGVRPQSSRSRHKLGDKTGPFNSVLSRKSNGEEMSNRERDKGCEAVSDLEITSTSGFEDDNMIMGSSLAQNPDVEDTQGDLESRLPLDSSGGFTSDMSPRRLSSEIVFSSSSSRRRRSGLKSRRFDSQSIKAQTSLQSCLMAQLYEACDESEEYARNSLGKPRLRPFLVTDGSRIISTAPCESLTEPIGTAGGERWVRKDGYSQVNSTVCGIPALPNIEPAEFGKRAKTREKQKHGFEGIHSSKASHGDHHANAQGTSNRALLFYFGLTLGVVSSFMANKQEVERMKSLLKQNENLVQDLQEELEMKDSLTVKELATDNYESNDVHNDYCTDDTVLPSSLKEKFDEESCHEKPEEQSLYAIEAELEVELQRLESSMNSSSLEGKLCNLSGFDPDFVSDFHEGKLRSRSFAAEFHGESDESRSSTPRSCPYPVSPRELSLRLHQVIQSRLEERIKELETALQNSQQKSKYMGSKHVHPWGELSGSGTRNSSTRGSPIARNGHEPMDEPVVISLSGEALAAYNEAYDVFTKVSESDEEDFQAGFENGCHAEHDLNEVQETVLDQRTEEDLYSPQNNALGCRRDEGEDCDEDDEIERLLIKQIVEKAKQGSPAVLKAQREFLLLDIENEH